MLAVETSTGYLYYYPGIGDGAMGPRVQIGTIWDTMTNITAGDFTGDGKDDVLAVQKSSGNLYLYQGSGTLNGMNTIPGPSRVQIGTGWGGMTNLTAIRLGNTEGLLAINSSNGNLYFYPASGSAPGMNTLDTRVQVGSGWNGMTSLTAPGILNKDGKADLVAVEASTGDLYAYPFTGTVNGTSTFGGRVKIDSGWNGMSYPAGGDFNGDGNGDVVAVNASSEAAGDLYFYPGSGALDGLNTFGSRTRIGTGW